MKPDNERTPDQVISECQQQAAERFLRRRAGQWSSSDQAAFDQDFDADARVATQSRAERAWHAIGHQADSPEMMVLREQTLARVRRARARRWRLPSDGVGLRRAAAGIAVIAVVFGLVWQFSPYGAQAGVYQTQVGEQRMIELEDRTQVALDADTRIRVRFSTERRAVEIYRGQAQFTVAKEAARPFKVLAGDHTIIALGTAFTVEYRDQKMNLAMLSGRVAVLSSPDEAASEQTTPLELSAGEGISIQQGKTLLIHQADLAAATAWRQGRVIFHDEPLIEAARRLNRYSRVQIAVPDRSLADLRISGVFELGDARAFAEALQNYLPVMADYSDDNRIVLRKQ